MSERLQRHQRIRGKKLFKTIFEEGRVSRGKYLHLKVLFLPSGPHPAPRLAVVVSKQVSPHAVDRNRWKRLIREAFRKSQSKIKDFSLIVVRVSPQETTRPSLSIIAEEILSLLNKTESLK